MTSSYACVSTIFYYQSKMTVVSLLGVLKQTHQEGLCSLFDIFKQLVIFLDLDLNVLIFNHLPVVVVSYDESLSDYVFNNVFEDE